MYKSQKLNDETLMKQFEFDREKNLNKTHGIITR